MDQSAIHGRFTAALDELVEQVKKDRTVLAAILCGSLSHDTVWARSDIDLVLVTLDDRKFASADVSLYADGLNVHAVLMPRSEFRQAIEASACNSFTHSLFAKSRLLYTHDDTIADLHARLQVVGGRDTELQLLRAATAALPAMYKAHKWFVTRGDLDYTALWILYAATSLARIEVLEARLIADREVIPQAMALNPEFFRTIYADLLNTRKTRRNVQAALDAMDGYVATRARRLFAPLTHYLREAGDVRSCTEIESHFARNFDVKGVTVACEYLADQGLIAKASAPVRLTKQSSIQVQELAFFHTKEPVNGPPPKSDGRNQESGIRTRE